MSHQKSVAKKSAAKSVHIAIIQQSAVHFNLEKSLDKAVALIKAAVAKGAELIVFGETWLSGYPVWLDHCPNIGVWNHPPMKKVFSKMYQNSIEVPGAATNLLATLARQHQVVIVIGANEVVKTGPGNGTIYNALLIFNEKGALVCHRRKLMPTFTEKLVHGLGDAKDLEAVDTAVGRIGGMICWEHWMPLTRMAMHQSNEHIHFSLFPMVHEMHQVTCRQYAFEGRCFVVAVGQVMRPSDFPEELELPEHLKNDRERMVLNGGSCVIAPGGRFLLEPQFDVDDTIHFEIQNMDEIYEERMTLDTSGHYNRPDVFDFKINRNRV